MFKNVISPIQAWLLSQSRCVGCGTSLTKGAVEKRQNGTEKITCACGRIFIRDGKTKNFRRALFEEI